MTARSGSGDRNIEAIYRLSPLQHGVLFHTLEAARPGVYFEQYGCRFAGALEVERLRRAWDEVARRHAVLRTLFSWERADQPLQIVRARVNLPWDVLDWRGLSAAEQAESWQAYLDADRERGFDLARAPLARFALMRSGEADYRFLWSFHHLLVDGWSMRLLLREAAQIYAGRGEALAPPRPYSDFIAWLERQDPAPAQAFWTDYLEGFTAPTCPPPDPAPEGGVVAATEILVEAALSGELHALARRAGLTLNTLVTGAWALALARHSDAPDVVFGVTVAGRPADLEGAEGIAGLFINTLPLRVRTDGEHPVIDWLAQLQSAQAHARRFEHTPLVSVQRCSELPPGTPLFETLVVYENFPAAPAADSAAPALPSALDEQYVEYSNYPLALLVVPGERLRLLAVHEPRWYAPATVERLLNHVRTVLAEFVSAPARALREVSLCPPGERALLLGEWNATGVDFADTGWVHEAFAACAARTPDAVAVATGEHSLGYAELEQRANRLARFLLRQGVGRDIAVALCMDRSVEALVAILGVLKAGGAYVPLDPAYPAERVRWVLEDLATAAGEPPLLLTAGGAGESLPALPARVIDLERDWPAIAREAPSPPAVTVRAQQLAYLIYTSGSTGRPKGVMVTHANLANSTRARAHHYPEPLTAFLLLSSLATDSSVAGVFWALSTGATLVVPRRRLEQDAGALLALIEAQRVSHFLCVPALYLALLEQARPAQLDSLAAVLVAGEACTAEVIARHCERLPGVALYNEYGPTEATVWATVARLDGDSASGRVPIGRPIANLRAYVLDAALQPVPVGLRGELCIGGAGVARGYLNNPALSAERFVSDPFAPTPGGRMYRTGDRAHYRADGTLEFDGRLDHQVKIRGYRVELAEIEQALGTHPQVAEVAVTLGGESPAATLAAEDPRRLAQLLATLDDAHAERLLQALQAPSPPTGEATRP